jgi:hypothetical protein
MATNWKDLTPHQMIDELNNYALFLRTDTKAPIEIARMIKQAAHELEFWEDTHIHRLGDWHSRPNIMQNG